MTFPGGSVSLPSTLLSTGMSGPQRVHAPEAPDSYAKLTDAALERLAENLMAFMEEHAREADQGGGLTPGLRDYTDLLWMQVTRELMRRMGGCP